MSHTQQHMCRLVCTHMNGEGSTQTHISPRAAYAYMHITIHITLYTSVHNSRAHTLSMAASD